MSQYQQVDYIFNNNNNNNSNNRNNSNLNNFSTKSSLQLRAILSNKILSVSNNVSQLTTHQIKSDYSHNKLIINDYILTESNNANVDSYGTAFNQITSKSYFWKVKFN
jgi:hypothetical protein